MICEVLHSNKCSKRVYKSIQESIRLRVIKCKHYIAKQAFRDHHMWNISSVDMSNIFKAVEAARIELTSKCLTDICKRCNKIIKQMLKSNGKEICSNHDVQCVV